MIFILLFILLVIFACPEGFLIPVKRLNFEHKTHFRFALVNLSREDLLCWLLRGASVLITSCACGVFCNSINITAEQEVGF